MKMTIKGIPAISATRLNGSWVIQTPYGLSARPVTDSEAAAIEAAWNGNTDGGGNDWHQLGTDAEINTL